MKYCFFLLVAIALGCGSKTTGNQTPAMGFNGFPWGTSIDSIESTVGFAAQKRTADKLTYSNVHFEGMPGSEVSYQVPGGRLKSGMCFKYDAKQADFDSLYARFVNRYGQPKNPSASVLMWTIADNEISLQLDGSTLLATASKRSPNR